MRVRQKELATHEGGTYFEPKKWIINITLQYDQNLSHLLIEVVLVMAFLIALLSLTSFLYDRLNFAFSSSYLSLTAIGIGTTILILVIGYIINAQSKWEKELKRSMRERDRELFERIEGDVFSWALEKPKSIKGEKSSAQLDPTKEL